MSPITLIAAGDGRRVRWKNDGGWTTEIARAPSAGGDFDWRISIAEIERDGPFSSFPGVERDLVLLSGAGIELDIDDAPPLRLDERFRRARFAGEARVGCRLLAGPTRDFNVMTKRDAYAAEVMARPLVDSMVLLPEARVVWIVHVFAGEARARGNGGEATASSGDTLRIDVGADAGRVAIGGGGELVLARLTARA